MIHFDSITPVSGDCTQDFKVYGFLSTNAYGFVREVLKQFSHGWGVFFLRFCEFDPRLSSFDLAVEYSNGSLKNAIPMIWKKLNIYKILSSGGYSRMDYFIYIS